MRLRRCELGFTLIEVIVVTAIVVIVAGTLGTFFLAGASPAVASAGRDVSAAFDEARRTALAFDAATVVFAPAKSGTGYSARIYQRFPGDPAFQPRNGPTYDSTVTIDETAAPLGAPGFALTVDAHGNVTGFANFTADATTFAARPCPASGAFILHLAYERDVRSITIPCALPLNSAAPVAFETPAPALSPLPAPSQTCPSSETCTLASITPPGGAVCPSGYTPDTTSPGLCDIVPTPSPTPSIAPTPGPPLTCPPGDTGTPPACFLSLPTASPPAKCVPGPTDLIGFATCIESDPVRATGPAITRASCGTHVPTTDPGPGFTVEVDVFKNGDLWGTYDVSLSTSRAPWLNLQSLPPSQTCGLRYTLRFTIVSAIPISGNAQSTPANDTADPGLADQGVGSILNPPLGAWGSDT
ncbi:MAG TPA: prepilin-type N-terminal cleavage/methylation domain-containing protein [Candidatus Lustribacter sp.]